MYWRARTQGRGNYCLQLPNERVKRRCCYFLRLCSMRGRGHRLKHKEFWSDIKQNYFNNEAGQIAEQQAWETAEPPSLVLSDLTKPCSLWAGGWSRQLPDMPSNLNCSIILDDPSQICILYLAAENGPDLKLSNETAEQTPFSFRSYELAFSKIYSLAFYLKKNNESVSATIMMNQLNK